METEDEIKICTLMLKKTNKKQKQNKAKEKELVCC